MHWTIPLVCNGNLIAAFSAVAKNRNWLIRAMQVLVRAFDEQRLGNDGTEAFRPCKPDDGDKQMKEKDEDPFNQTYVRILKEVLLIRYRPVVSLPRVYGFAGGRSLFQFDRSTLKRLAIARAMSSCTSKMSFSSRS